jgi:hypothetical protein
VLFSDCFVPFLDCLRFLSKPSGIPSQHGTTCTATPPRWHGQVQSRLGFISQPHSDCPTRCDSSLALVSGNRVYQDLTVILLAAQRECGDKLRLKCDTWPETYLWFSCVRQLLSSPARSPRACREPPTPEHPRSRIASLPQTRISTAPLGMGVIGRTHI